MYRVIKLTRPDGEELILRTDKIDYVSREPKNNYTEVHYIHLDGMPESFIVSERVECIKVLLWQLAQEELKK